MNIEGNIKVLRKKYHRSEEQKEAANINRVFIKEKMLYSLMTPLQQNMEQDIKQLQEKESKI